MVPLSLDNHVAWLHEACFLSAHADPPTAHVVDG
jgi:hypothetical protein